MGPSAREEGMSFLICVLLCSLAPPARKQPPWGAGSLTFFLAHSHFPNVCNGG